ncbi:MAG TPA: septation protein A [Bauldia sp.]|nr:septation protein A [Bauldia sp.]
MTFEPAPNDPGQKPINPLLKLALELGPLAVFFLANARGEWLAERIPALAALGGPLFVATALFVLATLISLGVSLALTRRLPILPLVSGIVVLVFGGLALWLHDETFIKMKPTIINALFGGLLLGGLALGKPLLGYVFDSAFRLTDEGWWKLTLRWGVFLLFLAVLNEIVWRTVPTDVWVTFKVFGLVGLTFVFTLFQLPLINRYALPEEGKPSS